MFAEPASDPVKQPSRTSRLYGCIYGGAVGDALGAPVEFLSLAEIRARFGPSGLTEYVEQPPAFTDDTQMTLWTAEGVLRAHNRWLERGIVSVSAVVANAYQRWYYTQTHDGFDLAASPSDSSDLSGWLIREPGIYGRRSPGSSCLKALQQGSPVTDSKGCGGVMRIAPLAVASVGEPFQLACDVAAITHGHPSGYLSAGALALILARLMDEGSLDAGIDDALLALQGASGGEEVISAIKRARELASKADASAEAVETLGTGWVAEEALAISLFCALCATREEGLDCFRQGVVLAANHGGDSDSTAAITGTLLGTYLGMEAIPGELIFPVQGRELIERICEDLIRHFIAPPPAPKCPVWWGSMTSYPPPHDLDRYPGI
jgi:ADP-ribosylglycohydrolase